VGACVVYGRTPPDEGLTEVMMNLPVVGCEDKEAPCNIRRMTKNRRSWMNYGTKTAPHLQQKESLREKWFHWCMQSTYRAVENEQDTRIRTYALAPLSGTAFCTPSEDEDELEEDKGRSGWKKKHHSQNQR
jgi:hypothetical protein